MQKTLARRAIGAALVLTQLTGCMTWRPVPGTLDQQAGAPPISRARLKLRDGSELPLRQVTVGADSVIGYHESSGARLARPVADVTSIHRRQLSAGRTTLVVGVTTLVALAALVASSIPDFMSECGMVCPMPSN